MGDFSRREKKQSRFLAFPRASLGPQTQEAGRRLGIQMVAGLHRMADLARDVHSVPMRRQVVLGGTRIHARALHELGAGGRLRTREQTAGKAIDGK